MQIFSHLELLDLINMCEMSSLLYKCAKLAFEMHYNAFIESDLETDDFKRALKYFGRTATGIEVTAFHFEGEHSRTQKSMELLEWIAKYCGSNIERLSMWGIKINLEKCSDSVAKANICRLMSQIKELEICGGHLYNSSLLFELCGSTVRILEIRSSRMDENTRKSFLRNYPRLYHLDFYYCGKFNLSKLLGLNPTIQHVVLRASEMRNQLFPVACRLPNLLGLDIFAEGMIIDLSPLDKIRNLERFHLSNFHGDDAIIQKLAHNHSKSLKWLKLDSVRVNIDFINHLKAFKNLQVLNLNELQNCEQHNTDDSDNSDCEFHPNEHMLRDLVNGFPKLRLLIVNNSVHLEQLKDICKVNTNDSKLIIFWGCNIVDRVKAISIKKMTIIKPRYDIDSLLRPIDLNISYDILAIYENVQEIIESKGVAVLKDPMELLDYN